MVDHRQIGQMAAEHLLGLGFVRFGYYGANTMWYSRQRHAGFANTVRKAGAECSLYSTGRLDQHHQLGRWLRGMRPPVGILASTDLRAAIIADVCMQIGLRIPDDVAVCGVDNNPSVCELSPVPLTSIARNDWKVGWEAAAMLDRLMHGEAIPQKPLLIKPEGIVTRKSTETMAINDPVLARLVAEARQQLHKPFGVNWFVQHSKQSRRWLEMRFREVLGQSPLAVINRLRVAKARELLAGAGQEERRLSDIAAQCGFADLRRLRLVFTKHTGITPKQFRHAVRKAASKGADRGVWKI
jgi:LacI family transcriptional regulator